jgi:hypothetical protein
MTEAPFELILCPYCGARLNRVETLLPTSCHECMHQRFKPKVMEVIKVKKENYIPLSYEDKRIIEMKQSINGVQRFEERFDCIEDLVRFTKRKMFIGFFNKEIDECQISVKWIQQKKCEKQ